jgi:hypothetical protein
VGYFIDYPYTLYNGEPADAAKIQANFQRVVDEINSNLAVNMAFSKLWVYEPYVISGSAYFTGVAPAERWLGVIYLLRAGDVASIVLSSHNAIGSGLHLDFWLTGGLDSNVLEVHPTATKPIGTCSIPKSQTSFAAGVGTSLVIRVVATALLPFTIDFAMTLWVKHLTEES